MYKFLSYFQLFIEKKLIRKDQRSQVNGEAEERKCLDIRFVVKWHLKYIKVEERGEMMMMMMVRRRRRVR